MKRSIDQAHAFSGRAEVIEHLERDHHWLDIPLSVVDGATSPDPLGWHTMEGGWMVGNLEILGIHRELHALSGIRCECSCPSAAR